MIHPKSRCCRPGILARCSRPRSVIWSPSLCSVRVHWSYEWSKTRSLSLFFNSPEQEIPFTCHFPFKHKILVMSLLASTAAPET